MNRLTIIRNKIKFENTCMLTFSGENSRTRPKIKVILVRELPITSPNARFIFLRFSALISTENSGKDVPVATIVAPTIDSAIPRKLAMFMAEETA
jgi:hypothetical protein